MKHFLILGNRHKDKDLKIAKRICSWITGQGGVCQIEDLCFRDECEKPDYALDGVECVIVLGGDGTILEVAGELFDYNIPILGIHLGTLGFLAEITVEELADSVDALLNDRFEIENRIMIRAEVYQKSGGCTQYVALNDFTVARSGFSRVIALSVRVNGALIDTYHGDGIIACTPTGSTGYNLSAGGPIINPTCKNFVMTPICSHSLFARSIVLAKTDILTIEVERMRKTQEEEAIVSFDGREGIHLKPGDWVKIYKAEEVTPFIKIKQRSFVEVLREKMSTV